MQITLFSEDKKLEWDSYVSDSPNASFFHLISWKDIISRYSNHVPYYLYAFDHDKICGILPLFLSKNIFWGSALISIPFAVYGGVCGDTSAIEKALIDHGKEIAKQMNVDYLELRHYSHKSFDSFISKDLYVTFVKELPVSADALWNILDRKARGAVRKGVKCGLKAEFNNERLKEFYNILSISYRNLGSPIISMKYLESLINCFSDRIKLLCIDHNHKMISGVLTFFSNKSVMPYYGGSLPEAAQHSANNFMYWELMKLACDQGFKYFDFGRSRIGSGSFNFKKNWGIEPKPLYYDYFLVGKKELPNFSPSNSKFAIARRIWHRLPLKLTTYLGPKLVPYFV